MNYKVIRYQTKPERTRENRDLIAAAFSELAEKRPDDVRYAAFSLPNDTFIHITAVESAPSLRALPSFARFAEGSDDRVLEESDISDAVVIGNYRVLA